MSGGRSSRPSHPGAAAVAFVAAVSGLAIWSEGPPSPRPDLGTPPAEFSSGRAMRHVEAIARAPHPVGSAEAGRVRGYIAGELESLGLRPEVQEVPPRPGAPDGLRNVLARLRGTGPPGELALLLMAHSDSVPTGPGAGDDAAGVAAILESLRALESGPPLERDVIALFTDGEEAGLLGAEAFFDHPWSAEVGLALNFEGRGNGGPVFMFETSEPNGWLIDQFARSAPYPVANSLSYTIYRMMPNNTDLTVFKRRGVAGMNFAFGDGLAYYHTPQDTPAHLDERSLQHHGSYALALARHFGRLDLGDAHDGPDPIYFTVPGPRLVVYPTSWAVPLMTMAALAYLAVLVAGLLTGRATFLGLYAGIALFLIALVAAGVAAELAWWALRAWRPVSAWRPYDAAILAGLAALGFALMLAAYAPAWRKAGPIDLHLGALAWWLVVAILSALWLPGGSYLFAWPLLFGLISPAAAVLAGPDSRAARVADYLGAVPALVLMAPILDRLFHAISLMAPGAVLAPFVLTLGAILPMVRRVVAPGRRTEDLMRVWAFDDSARLPIG